MYIDDVLFQLKLNLDNYEGEIMLLIWQTNFLFFLFLIVRKKQINGGKMGLKFIIWQNNFGWKKKFNGHFWQPKMVGQFFFRSLRWKYKFSKAKLLFFLFNISIIIDYKQSRGAPEIEKYCTTIKISFKNRPSFWRLRGKTSRKRNGSSPVNSFTV